MLGTVIMGSNAMQSSRFVMVEVPLPEEVVELAKVRGVDIAKLVEAAKKLLILEIVAMDSKLNIDDAIELSEEVTKRAWERLKERKD
ncbi:MAG TPA: hypothetical protein ENF93_02010 [Ignisphaera sp.]|nr:hypothetical protein [Ignisphaera sp.]